MIKKYFVFLTLFFTFSINISAQNINEVNIGVICPEQIEGLSNATSLKLKNKIEQIVSYNGISTYMDGGFVIYPIFEINDRKKVEGGMRNIMTIQGGVTLFIKQISTGIVANSINITMRGSGFTEGDAIANALAEIDVRDKQLADFITNGKIRILKHYEDNCQRIIANAKSLARMGQYEEALSILAVYPSSLSSYNMVSLAMNDIYKQYINNSCSIIIQKAKGCIAIKDYQGAAAVLIDIDPESHCQTESIKLLNQINQSIDVEEAKQLDLNLKEFNANVDLEKRRIEAVKSIAKAYYSNQQTVYYNQIWR